MIHIYTANDDNDSDPVPFKWANELLEHEKTFRDMIKSEEECRRNWDLKLVFAKLCFPSSLYAQSLPDYCSCPEKRARSDSNTSSYETDDTDSTATGSLL